MSETKCTLTDKELVEKIKDLASSLYPSSGIWCFHSILCKYKIDKPNILLEELCKRFESLSEKSEKIQDKIFIPFQKCPVCEGYGKVFNSQLDPFSPNTNIGYHKCHVCKGEGIIPMKVI